MRLGASLLSDLQCHQQAAASEGVVNKLWRRLLGVALLWRLLMLMKSTKIKIKMIAVWVSSARSALLLRRGENKYIFFVISFFRGALVLVHRGLFSTKTKKCDSIGRAPRSAI